MLLSPKILIVDDDADNRLHLVDALESKGYVSITADSGKSALQKIKEEQPDLVLLDVMMPGMTGYEVCQRLREDPVTTLLPIVLVTGASPEERVKGIEAGSDDFLTKPVNHSELFARVRSLLRIKDLHDVVQAQTTQLGKWNSELQAKLEQETKLAEVARMLGDIGHDVKNLLMPILTGGELLQDELRELFAKLPPQNVQQAKASQEMCTEIVDMVRNSAQRIQGQVREIADCVKGLDTPLRMVPCHMVTVVDTVYKTLRVLANQRGIRLHTQGLEDLPKIQADEGRLFKALYNLISNALAEFSDEGTITVQGKIDPDGKHVWISVADTGPGMRPEIRDKIFNQTGVSQKPGGTGLGTKIVKDAVDAHKGHITLESELGIGTTFHICLPIECA